MPDTNNYVAIDLGATSGRAIVGHISNGKLSTEEIYRFPNAPIERDGHLLWDIDTLFAHVTEALKIAAASGKKIESIGIDTWGVDVVFFDKDGKPFGNQYAYRDHQTDGIPERFFREAMTSEELYRRCGIQVMNFNTVFQLFAIGKGEDEVGKADRILFIPDALSYMLSGRMVTEYTIASTSAMLDPNTHMLDEKVLRAAGVRPAQFAPVVPPGTVLGTITEEIARKTGLDPNVKVIAIAGHDTASAVAAVPAENDRFAYLSSGTWSLMGIESSHPVINSETESLNVTNEGGIDYTTRLLKNITGMWILEQCQKCWQAKSRRYSYDELARMASTAEHFRRFIDPDCEMFAAPDNMLSAIDSYLTSTGQELPLSDADYVACIYESLALKYRYVFSMFRRLSSVPIDVLHIIGGGSQNSLLNQYTASSTGVTVKAGPSEATSIGNIMMQARANGAVASSLEMRKVIRDSVTPVVYYPTDGEKWDKAYEKFIKTIKLP